MQLSTYEDYIQTDATIHLGSSGGALIDHQGRLVGINTLIYTAGTERNGETPGIGINLATPSTLAAGVLNDIVKYGHVIRGWLGVSVEVLLGEQQAGGPVQQLIVTDLAPGGPAQRAGIQLNDIIVAMDGEPVLDGRAAMLQIAQLRPGHLLRVNLDREGVPIEWKPSSAPAATADSVSTAHALLGLARGPQAPQHQPAQPRLCLGCVHPARRL